MKPDSKRSNRNNRLIDRIFAFVIVMILAGIGWLCCDPNVTFNFTASMPVGLWYRIDSPCCKHDDVVLLNNALIASRRGQNFRQGLTYGYFDEKTPLMKRIKALPGDIVSMTDNGIEVNGRLLPSTRAREHDGLGRVLIRAEFKQHKLKPDEFLAVGDSDMSFDARYFGVVTRDEIISTVIPLFVFDE